MATSMPIAGDMLDRLEIRELLENWVIWRDAGDWERFATLWHDDGRMIATWFQAGAAEFIVDALEKRDGRWGIVLRQPVYELDRMTTVEPNATLKLDPHLLQSFPEGYRHLAYLQTQMGFQINHTLPGTRGFEIEALGTRMQQWLDGDEASCLDT